MRRDDSLEQVLRYAYRLLSYRGRSEKELSERLRMKGFDEDSINRAISGLRSDGYLDDRRLAVSIRRYAEESKYLSLPATRMLLKERGIPPALIDEALAGFDEPEVAKRLVERRLRRMKSDDNAAIRRLEGMLLRRGFLRGTIQEVIKSFHLKGDRDEAD